jgi:hypothetical protein
LGLRSLGLALVLFVAGCHGPLPFMSGGALDGEEREGPSTWALADDVGVVQLETRPEDPYSVNIAYTQLGGRLYINAGDTETQWVKNMNVNPLVRLRIEEDVYALRAERVVDPAEISEFAEAWTSQSIFYRDPVELDEVWIYRLTAR